MTRVSTCCARRRPALHQAARSHVLLHGLAGAGLFELDLVAPLRPLGTVYAPDLPGSILGATVTPRPGAARNEVNARCVPALGASAWWEPLLTIALALALMIPISARIYRGWVLRRDSAVFGDVRVRRG